MSQYESHALRRVCAGGLLAFLGVYALLEKKKLPRSWWRPLSRFYFFPMAVQLAFKFIVWPLDIINYKGKCTFNLAYPQFKKQNKYVIASRRGSHQVGGFYLS